jgi:hypothetical protein
VRKGYRSPAARLAAFDDAVRGKGCGVLGDHEACSGWNDSFHPPKRCGCGCHTLEPWPWETRDEPAGMA